MLNEEIKVTENEGKTVTVLTLEDCEKYHGLKRYGGLALCFRIMKFALDRLVPEGEAARRKLITFKTAFDGPGITDSAELIGRCVTRNVLWRFQPTGSKHLNASGANFISKSDTERNS